MDILTNINQKTFDQWYLEAFGEPFSGPVLTMENIQEQYKKLYDGHYYIEAYFSPGFVAKNFHPWRVVQEEAMESIVEILQMIPQTYMIIATNPQGERSFYHPIGTAWKKE